MQANWIGRSEGAEVDFTLCDEAGEPTDTKITVFTTRADTLFGCSFFLLAPEYEGLMDLVAGTEYEAAVREVVEGAAKVSAVERAQGTLEKHGAFTGRYVMNPVNGEKVPVWVADYVDQRLRHRCRHGGPLRRPARLRVRPQVRPAHRSHHPGRRRPRFCRRLSSESIGARR